MLDQIAAYLSSKKVALDLLQETGVLGYRPLIHLSMLTTSCAKMLVIQLIERDIDYLLEKLIYLSHTWTDIANAVNIVSQFMHNPRISHVEAVHCILQYLKSAPGNRILYFNHGHLRLEAFTDGQMQIGPVHWMTEDLLLVTAHL